MVVDFFAKCVIFPDREKGLSRGEFHAQTPADSNTSVVCFQILMATVYCVVKFISFIHFADEKSLVNCVFARLLWVAWKYTIDVSLFDRILLLKLIIDHFEIRALLHLIDLMSRPFSTRNI